MKTKTTFGAVVGAMLLAIGVTTVVLINEPGQRPQANSSPQAAVEAASTDIVSFTAEKGKTVLAQLKEKATVETKDSQFGPYVDAINGKKGGIDNKYWSFYINGELAQVGAADYITDGGETIEWKFE